MNGVGWDSDNGADGGLGNRPGQIDLTSPLEDIVRLLAGGNINHSCQKLGGLIAHITIASRSPEFL